MKKPAIEIRCTDITDPGRFEVVVRDEKSESCHEVTMSAATFQRLAGDISSPQQFIEAAFRFLLDREPKESILGKFDVTIISYYFPEFEREIPRYLSEG